MNLSFTVGLVLVSVVLLEGTAIAYQTMRLSAAQKISTDLAQEIVDMKAAKVLTDRLHEYNAEITQDQIDLNKEIEVAAGYNDPLSPDILRILGRLRETTSTAKDVSR